MPIHILHCLAGCQTKHEVWIGAQIVRHDARDE
jgi:hypothetical protein